MDVYKAAKAMVEKLVSKGHIAYFAGGWVRDHLLGKPSSDIDIATSATPEQVMALFPRTVPVGISFGVVLVVIGEHPFEVATFRLDGGYVDGRRPESIELSTPEEDAIRRDFTINGMFYDPRTEHVYDYVEGRQDLQNKIIRAIGNPHERFREDRLRMVRAVRFAARLDFALDPDTEQAIVEHAPTLFPAVAMERIWQELVKIVENGRAAWAFVKMHELGLLQEIFPELKVVSNAEIKKMVAAYARFPKEAPEIAWVVELFPEVSLEGQLALCERLKISTADSKFVLFLWEARERVSRNEVGDVEWVYFYADARAKLALEVIAARMKPDASAAFLKAHLDRQGRLQAHIKRLQSKRPVVTSQMLLARGVTPGKLMGDLLREAEKLSITRNLDSPEAILALLLPRP